LIEAIVGVAASRLRDLFAKPSRRRRSSSSTSLMRSAAHGSGPVSISGGSDELEQTLEMWILQGDIYYRG
jgi:ATP-dependent Zn protease